MKKQYTKQQIKEAINYWQKQLNEDKNTDMYDTVKDAVEALNREFTYMVKGIEKASDAEYNVINKVLAWEDTSKGLGMAINDLINLLGYQNEIKF